MKFRSFITEKRSHPELNPKISWDDQLKKYIDKPWTAFSLTDIDKIGVNPHYNYNTPLGVYFYIANSENFDKVFDKNTFAAERPFIWIVKVNDSKILNIDRYPKGDLERDLQILRDKYEALKNDFTYNDILKKSSKGNLHDGTTIFYFTHNLAKHYPGPPAHTWTRILQKDLGYDGVWDNGTETIHPAESYQFVSFTPKTYTIIDKIQKSYGVNKNDELGNKVNAIRRIRKLSDVVLLFKAFGEFSVHNILMGIVWSLSEGVKDEYNAYFTDNQNRYVNVILDRNIFLKSLTYKSIEDFIKNIGKDGISKIVKTKFMGKILSVSKVNDKEQMIDLILLFFMTYELEYALSNLTEYTNILGEKQISLRAYVYDKYIKIRDEKWANFDALSLLLGKK